MYYDAERIYIDCEVLWRCDGSLMPAAVYWPDPSGSMIRYEVTKTDRVTDTEILSDTGFLGQLYCVHINGRNRRLFYEHSSGLWFVEIRKSTSSCTL